MAQTFHRDRSTWLLYLFLAFYGYFLNILGPITPFLKDELALSYTVSSLHFTAFAVGILLVGVGGHLVVRRLGRGRALWLGALGMSVSALLLVAGRSAPLTIGASFCMGLVGSLLLAVVPPALSDLHGELRAVALSEANVIASLISTAAPLLVGWFAPLRGGPEYPAGGWRLALVAAACAPFLMRLGFRHATLPQSLSGTHDSPSARRPLPLLFWVYWAALVLAVSVEFCMVFWSADYVEKSLGLLKAHAAQSTSLFLAGMILGRLVSSRLVQRFSAHRVVMASLAVAGSGFLLFWMTHTALLGLVGLFVTGLGVAGLYPLLLALALGVARDDPDQAGARTTLASGTAILALPLVLGRLADLVGIRPAYGVVGILLIGILLITLITGKKVQFIQDGDRLS
ncbi:MAG: MFS transporter [Anaerolineae bacterium]|nr:MFS transporter [Anaerolineae bacterium]